MNIGLIDIDTHNFPNIALMKLSAWHKKQGDKVYLLHPDDILDGRSLFVNYDKLYGSCVFDWNKSTCEKLAKIGVIVGGSGSGNNINLTDEQEHIYPDYSLYGIKNTAYGFLTRGCPRKCPFCIVANKEGTISRKVADLSEFWHGERNIIICDPNILACKDRYNLLEQLAKSEANVDFNQGLDIRLIDKGIIELLKSIKLKTFRFAWDDAKDKLTLEKLEYVAKELDVRKNERKYRVYVLTNYNSNFLDDLYRVDTLRYMGYDPYVMIYDKQNAPRYIRRLQRYVNNKTIFRTCKSFAEYKG